MKTVFFAEENTDELQDFVKKRGRDDILVLKDKYVLSNLNCHSGLDPESSKILKQVQDDGLKKPKTIIWEKVLDKNDREKIDDKAIYFTRHWYKKNGQDFSKADFLSLGSVTEYLVMPYLIKTLKFLVAAEKIIKQEQPDEVILQTSLSEAIIKKADLPKFTILQKKEAETAEAAKESRWRKFLKNILAKFYLEKKNQKTKDGLLISSALADLVPLLSKKKIQSHVFVPNQDFSDDRGRGIKLLKKLSRQTKRVTSFNPRFDNLKKAEKNARELTLGIKKEIKKSSIFQEYPGVKPLFQEFLCKTIFPLLPGIISFKEQTEKYLAKEKIKLLLLENDVLPFNKALVLIARKMKVRSFMLQHGLLCEENGHERIFADGAIVWGRASVNWYLQRGNEGKVLKITGNPKFDIIFKKDYFERKIFFKRLGLDPGKKTIVFASQPYGIDELSAFIDQEERENTLKMISAACKKLPGLQLIIKIHPREEIAYYQDLCQKIGLGDKVPILKEIDLHNLIKVSDGVIIKNSTVGLEALMLGVKILCLNVTLRKSLIPYAAEGIAALAENKKEIEEDLERLVRLETKLEREKREIFVFNYNFRSDGKAAERVADFLASEITKEESKKD